MDVIAQSRKLGATASGIVSTRVPVTIAAGLNVLITVLWQQPFPDANQTIHVGMEAPDLSVPTEGLFFIGAFKRLPDNSGVVCDASNADTVPHDFIVHATAIMD